MMLIHADEFRWDNWEMKVQKIEPQETHKQSHTEWKHRSRSENSGIRYPNDVTKHQLFFLRWINVCTGVMDSECIESVPNFCML